MRIGHLTLLLRCLPHVPKAKRLPGQIFFPGPMERERRSHRSGQTSSTAFNNSHMGRTFGKFRFCYQPGLRVVAPRPSQGLAPAARWQAKPLDATCPKPRDILVGRANQASICRGPNLANGARNNISRRHPESPGRAIPPITWTLRKSGRPDLSRPVTMRRATPGHCPLARVRTITNYARTYKQRVRCGSTAGKGQGLH